MSKRVTVVLTVAEAEALTSMAGQTSCDPGAMRSTLGERAPSIAAGYRAQEKLNDAIRAAGGFRGRVRPRR